MLTFQYILLFYYIQVPTNYYTVHQVIIIHSLFIRQSNHQYLISPHTSLQTHVLVPYNFIFVTPPLILPPLTTSCRSKMQQLDKIKQQITHNTETIKNEETLIGEFKAEKENLTNEQKIKLAELRSIQYDIAQVNSPLQSFSYVSSLLSPLVLSSSFPSGT